MRRNRIELIKHDTLTYIVDENGLEVPVDLNTVLQKDVPTLLFAEELGCSTTVSCQSPIHKVTIKNRNYNTEIVTTQIDYMEMLRRYKWRNKK